MIEVCLISRSEPTWPLWLNAASKLLERSVSISLDRRQAPLIGPAAFIASLAEFSSEGTDAQKIWQEPGLYLRHAHASLLCLTPLGFPSKLLQVGDLKLVIADNHTHSIFVASGTLEEWRNAAVNGTSSHVQDVRTFFDRVVMHFEIQGLGFVFSGYGRRERSDGTFSLMKV